MNTEEKQSMIAEMNKTEQKGKEIAQSSELTGELGMMFEATLALVDPRTLLGRQLYFRAIALSTPCSTERNSMQKTKKRKNYKAREFRSLVCLFVFDCNPEEIKRHRVDPFGVLIISM
jgi:ribonucleotide reductase alpha subunit